MTICDYRALCLATENLYKEIRNIFYLISSAKFKFIWTHSSEKDKKELEEHLFNGRCLSIKLWYNSQRIKQFRFLTYKELLMIARKYSIPDCSFLTKEELEGEIRERSHQAKTSGNSSTSRPDARHDQEVQCSGREN